MSYGYCANLARAFFPSSYRHIYMAIFNAYFDASGAQDKRGLSVAGFVSKPAKWDSFQRQWLRSLPKGMDMFHMTDFVSSLNGWEEWRGKSKERAILISDLVQIIKQNTSSGFAVTIMKRHYDEANKEFMLLEEHGPPYIMCGIAALSQLKNWAQREKVGLDQILCIFEEGEADWAALEKIAKADGFDVDDRSKKRIRAFDACDLAAWRARIILDDTYTHSSVLGRAKDGEKVMRALAELESIVHDNGMIRTRGLKRICGELGISRRNSP